MATPPQPLFAMPADDAVWAATVASMTHPSADTNYAKENVQGADPSQVAKTDGNVTSTITFTTSSIVPVAAAVIHTNAATGSFAGHAFSIPTAEADGQRRHFWIDLRPGLAANTSWAFVLTTAGDPLFVGRLCILTALRDARVKYGWRDGITRPGDTRIVTRMGTKIKLGQQLRTKWFKGVVDHSDSESDLRTLEKSAKGTLLPFLFIPDEAAVDAVFVSFPDDFKFSVGVTDYDVRDVPLEFEELCVGPPNL